MQSHAAWPWRQKTKPEHHFPAAGVNQQIQPCLSRPKVLYSRKEALKCPGEAAAIRLAVSKSSIMYYVFLTRVCMRSGRSHPSTGRSLRNAAVKPERSGNGWRPGWGRAWLEGRRSRGRGGRGEPTPKLWAVPAANPLQPGRGDASPGSRRRAASLRLWNSLYNLPYTLVFTHANKSEAATHCFMKKIRPTLTDFMPAKYFSGDRLRTASHLSL